jgi:hypothetical protein
MTEKVKVLIECFECLNDFVVLGEMEEDICYCIFCGSELEHDEDEEEYIEDLEEDE